MLPKRNRLRSSGRIKEVIKIKQIHFSSPLLFIAAMGNNSDTSRMAVVCSKKIGNAVVRNKTKRRVAAAMAKIWHKIAKNIDMVIILRRGLMKTSEYQETLEKGIIKLNKCQE